MLHSAFINIWNKRVGAVVWNANTGIADFQFAPDFLNSDLDIAPFTMPLRNGDRIYSFQSLISSSTFKGLPGLIADTLPDKYGNALINTWLSKQGRVANSLNPVETLCFIGKRGIGALEFEPVRPSQAQWATKIELNELIIIAEKILSGRSDFMADLSHNEEKAMFDILKIGSSVGGARAKALIAYNERTGEVRSGQANAPKGFNHWLIKFDGVTDSQFGASFGYGRVEMAYYKMAIDAGIQMMESRLLEENDRAHFMTRRFDRTENNEKLHFQSFCALRHFDFNDVGLYSYEMLFETMRGLGLTYPEAQQVFSRMVFNVMARNCDDHTKNFGFVMDPSGRWRIAPAYDVCHAYRPDSQWVSQHALRINGKRDGITKSDLLEVGAKMNIKNSKEIIDRVSQVVSNWDTYASEVGVSKELTRSIRSTLKVL